MDCGLNVAMVVEDLVPALAGVDVVKGRVAVVKVEEDVDRAIVAGNYD